MQCLETRAVTPSTGSVNVYALLSHVGIQSILELTGIDAGLLQAGSMPLNPDQMQSVVCERLYMHKKQREAQSTACRTM